MITQLCESGGNFFSSWGLLILMIALLALLFVFSGTRRKKEAKMAEEFVNGLKVGDKIKTYSGIYGTILSLKETPEGKVAMIETGERGSKTTMLIDLFAIYCVVAPTQDANAKGIEKMEQVAEENNKAKESPEEVVKEVEKSDAKVSKTKKTPSKK